MLIYNVRSILDFKRRTDFANAVNACDHYDILCLTETWLTDDIPDSGLFLGKYLLHRSDREQSHGRSNHGGVLIAITSTIQHQRLTIPPTVTDCLVLCLCLNNTKCLLCCIYCAPFPSVYRQSPRALDDLLLFLDQTAISIGNCFTIIVGDINFSHTNWETMQSDDDLEQITTERLFEQSFQQLISGKRLLDVILCNRTDYVLNVFMEKQMNKLHKSDHRPYGLKITGTCWSGTRKTQRVQMDKDFSKFAYSKTDWDSLSEQIVKQPFQPYCYSNVNVLLETWYDWLLETFEKNIPTKTRHRMNLAPWITSSTSNLLKKRETLLRALARKPSDGNKRKLRNIDISIEQQLINDKTEFEKEVFSSGQFSKVQKYFKSISKATALPSELYFGNCKESSDEGKARLFNEYFQSVFTTNDYNRQVDLTTPSKLTEFHFTADEIEKVLSKLSGNKAKGPDGLGNLVLKKLSRPLSKSLTTLFNTITNKGVYPSKWKTGHVTPIFKEGDKQSVEKYRPITLLSNISKVIEKLLFDKIFDKIEMDISPKQYGFTKQRSTITQMIMFLSEVFDNLNQSTLAALYIDFQKAFDKVNHEMLLEKIHGIGIHGNALKLLESYIIGRRQRVKVGSATSAELAIHSGVPQGSVLGPLLFIVYINDLPDCIMCNSYGYADDYKIIGTNGVTLQIDATRLNKWCEMNMMTMNAGKCKLVCFKNDINICINGELFEHGITEKDLGIMICKDLTWTQQAERRSSKATGAFQMIKRNISPITIWQTKRNLYICYIVPILSYGMVLWKPSKEDMKKMETVQKRATSWILNTKQLDYKERLKRLQLLPFSLYQELHVVLMFIDILNNRYNIAWTDYVQIKSNVDAVTRNKGLTTFATRNLPKVKQESDFWLRATKLSNIIGSHIGQSVIDIPKSNVKSRLTAVFQNYFNQKFDPKRLCTWRL